MILSYASANTSKFTFVKTFDTRHPKTMVAHYTTYVKHLFIDKLSVWEN